MDPKQTILVRQIQSIYVFRPKFDTFVVKFSVFLCIPSFSLVFFVLIVISHSVASYLYASMVIYKPNHMSKFSLKQKEIQQWQKNADFILKTRRIYVWNNDLSLNV